MVTSTDQPTDQQVIEHLATKVMEWHKGTHYIHGPLMHGGSDRECWCTESKQIEAIVKLWNPLLEENIAQAMQVVDAMLEKGYEFSLEKSKLWTGGLWRATFMEQVTNASRTRAISMAACEATKE